ncbi:MAG: YtxH domain-containing protein [Gemmatimonadota bacterium]|nr:MAG: YtxH domain-containing protein [Gemmatimonadota bacterium]
MSHGENQPVIVVEKSSGIGSFLWGAVIGAGVALLLAPRTGEETRAELRSRGRRLRAKAEDTADELQARLEDGYERAKARVEEKFERTRKNLSETRAGARDAVRAGKAAVHSAREELERRLADAKVARQEDAEADLDVDDIDSDDEDAVVSEDEATA